LTKSDLIGLIVDNVTDNRDGQMSILPSNVVLKNNDLVDVVGITASGTYSMTFNYSDIAQNYLDGVVVNLNIIA
jgi:glycine cleavage system aminomethyltransferase T